MRYIAVRTAVMGFFVLAVVGWLSDVPIFHCGMRALGGALIVYVGARTFEIILMGMIAEVATRPDPGSTGGGNKK